MMQSQLRVAPTIKKRAKSVYSQRSVPVPSARPRCIECHMQESGYNQEAENREEARQTGRQQCRADIEGPPDEV